MSSRIDAGPTKSTYKIISASSDALDAIVDVAG
jgi:hypothetical protein